jgi:hypothetical protein
MRGRLVVLLGLSGCAVGPGGTDPLVAPPPPRVLGSSVGDVRGAAIGWSLGAEVHVFVVDDSFAERAYARLGTARLLSQYSDVRGALDQRPSGVVAIAIAGQELDSQPRGGGHGLTTASILSRGRVAQGELTLIRIHSAGACAQPQLVTELVYRLPPEQSRFAPPAQAQVVAVFGGSPVPARSLRPPPALTPAARSALLAAVATRAAHATSPAALPPEHLLTGEVAVDPERAADAGEVLTLAGLYPRLPHALAVRVRVLESAGDTVLVTAVAMTDSAGARVRWVMRPLRFRLRAGFAEPAAGRGAVRYVLRGAALSPDHGELLLIDLVNDVSPGESRILAVNPGDGRVLAAQPLALRCR